MTRQFVVTSSPADLFAELASTQVRVFSLRERKMVSTFEVPEAPDPRHAVLVPGPRPLFVHAAIRDHGVCAYDATNGALVWQRKDLNRTAFLVHVGGEPDKQVVATAREDGLGWALNAENGKAVAPLRTIRELYAAPERSLFLTASRTELTLRDASTWSALARPPLFKVTGRSLTLLDAAISDEQVVIARPSGDFGGARLEAFSHTGQKRWNFDAAPRAQFVAVVPAESGFVAIESSPGTEGKNVVVRLDAGGKEIHRRDVGAVSACPFDRGRLLLSSGGEIRATDSEEVIWSVEA